MYAVRIAGEGWLWKCGRNTIIQDHLNDASHYKTREEAVEVTLLTACQHPDYIGRFRIKKIRRVDWKRSPSDMRVMWVS